MNAKIILLLGLAAMVAADYGDSSESFESFESSEAKYSFKWDVNDASSQNYFGQEEARDGDNTQGNYYVQLPDGRLQKVAYYVDGDDGYIADVKYEGSASFESAESRSRESYYYGSDSDESK